MTFWHMLRASLLMAVVVLIAFFILARILNPPIVAQTSSEPTGCAVAVTAEQWPSPLCSGGRGR